MSNLGIWKFSKLLPNIPSQYRLSLGEGNTPLRKIENIYFKCEYENPNGSYKDRGITYQVSALLQKGIKKAVISSSGNAAISASAYCSMADIELTVFVSDRINKSKLQALKKLHAKIILTKKPLSRSIQFSKSTKAYNLRQSTDPNAVPGFMTISFEIIKEIEPDAVFIPVSSGTALQGIHEGFASMGFKPAMHAVQTEAVHPVAGVFDTKYIRRKKSLADAIVARFTPRQDEIIKIIHRTSGWGWVVSDREMEEARKYLLPWGIGCSYEGYASLAALWKAKSRRYTYRNPVCILSGKYYS